MSIITVNTNINMLVHFGTVIEDLRHSFVCSETPHVNDVICCVVSYSLQLQQVVTIASEVEPQLFLACSYAAFTRKRV